MALKGPQGIWVFLDRLAPPDRLERRGRRARLVLKGYLALKAPQDRLVLKASPERAPVSGWSAIRSGLMQRRRDHGERYCAGGAATRIDGTSGASCDGGAKAVIVARSSEQRFSGGPAALNSSAAQAGVAGGSGEGERMRSGRVHQVCDKVSRMLRAHMVRYVATTEAPREA